MTLDPNKLKADTEQFLKDMAGSRERSSAAIDVHEDHATLPGLDELRGTSPKFEEGMSSEEFVRSIRDANW
jgi:hypothetical protein